MKRRIVFIALYSFMREGDTDGSISRKWFADGYTLYQKDYSITGYPGHIYNGDIPADEYNFSMYEGKGTLIPSADGKIFDYTIDTSKGNSGAPVYSSGQIVYGIDVNGVGEEPPLYNSATRIRSDLYQRLVEEKYDGIEYWKSHDY